MSTSDINRTIDNIFRGCKAIIESGDHKNIARLHAINDFHQNEIERILYGKTVKELRNEIIKKNKQRLKE